MDVTFPGDVVEIIQNRADKRQRSIMICIDRHHGLFLLALCETPFHKWYVKIEERIENFLDRDIYVQTNVLHQPENFSIDQYLGKLSRGSRDLIVEGAQKSASLYRGDKEIIEDRLLGESDISYYSVGELPDDVPFD
jgi:hypothetical protein